MENIRLMIKWSWRKFFDGFTCCGKCGQSLLIQRSEFALRFWNSLAFGTVSGRYYSCSGILSLRCRICRIHGSISDFRRMRPLNRLTHLWRHVAPIAYLSYSSHTYTRTPIHFTLSRLCCKRVRVKELLIFTSPFVKAICDAKLQLPQILKQSI